MEASSTKCKVKHLIDKEGYKKGIQQRHTYIAERNRNKCSAIFATQTKMLCVKNNYPGVGLPGGPRPARAILWLARLASHNYS